MKGKLNKILYFALPLILFACIVALWGVSAKLVNNNLILPTVLQTLKEFFALFGNSEFYASLLGTLLRSLIAFAISFSLAGILAYLSAKNPYAKRVITPVIGVFRALPTIAVVLLLTIWTNSLIAPVIVTILVVMPTAYTNLYNAINGVDKGLLEMCKVYRVPKKTVLLKVTLPAILPDVYRSAGSGLSLNLKLMVAAEVLASTARSMGYMLKLSQIYYETARLIALVLVVVVLGLTIELAFDLIAKKREDKYL